jgi:hypothetical protein
MTQMESIYLAIVIATFALFGGALGLLSLRQTRIDLRAARERVVQADRPSVNVHA